jgi:aspartyl protease family protein
MKLAEILAALAITFGCAVVVSRFIVPEMQPATAPEPPRPVTSPAARAAPAPAANAALLKLEDDGHYWASAEVDGRAVKFMVDTGASTVALTYNDALRIGLNPDQLDYSWRIRTAGGEVKGASVRLSAIRIGQVEVENIEAMVLRDGLSQSLLGMTFLRELDSYEFRRGKLILRQ